MIEGVVERVVIDILRAERELELEGLGKLVVRKMKTEPPSVSVQLRCGDVRGLRSFAELAAVTVRAPSVEAELVQRGHSAAVATALVDAVFGDAIVALAEEDIAMMGELGVIYRSLDEPRAVYDPERGEKVMTPPRVILKFRPTEAVVAMVGGREPLPAMPHAELASILEQHRDPITTPERACAVLEAAGVPLLPPAERERRLAELDRAAGGRWPEPWRTLVSYQTRAWFCPGFYSRELVDVYEDWRKTDLAELGGVRVMTDPIMFVHPATPERAFTLDESGPSKPYDFGPWLAMRLCQSDLIARLRRPVPRALDAIGMNMVAAHGLDPIEITGPL